VAPSSDSLHVFVAKTIITMNRSMPEATAVAVRDGKIVEVGTLESLRPWLSRCEHTIDRTFENNILVPGLIDPHLHPAMAAVILPMKFVTAMEWRFPWGTINPTLDSKGFDARVAELAAEHNEGSTAKEPLIIWGHHDLWHGDMSRTRVNAIDPKTPIVIWNRSFHELCMNDGALELLSISDTDDGNRHQVDLPRGRFYENGLGFAIQKLNPWILAPERFAEGMQRLKQVVHFGGQTTIGDMAVGIFDFAAEMAAMRQVLDTPDTPFRTELVPHGALLGRGITPEAARDIADDLPEQNSHRMRYTKRIKLFADGAFFAQVAQLQFPGYIDGHDGEWLMIPEQLESLARLYWLEGYQIHIHVCGDLGVELALDVLERLQWQRPRFNHGFTLEHFGYSTPEQIQRAKALGANISANVYYLHELSDLYAQDSVGFERASSMSRLGSAMNAGITTALHSDFTMAPASPLNSMWVAVNRLNAVGDVMCPEERLTPQQALEAVTINAAQILGCADEVGSIRGGKKADFTVLDANPLTVDPIAIRDIQVLATVFEGEVFPITQPNS